MTKEPEHSKLGASSADRWMKCPGSVRLCEEFPETESSPYAEEGIKAHELAEGILLKELGKCIDSGFPTGDSELDAAVAIYVGYILPKYMHFGFTQIDIEKRVNLAFIDGCMFGTADCILYNDLTNEIEIIDYKHGAGVVVEADCTQLKYYALGALNDLLTTKLLYSRHSQSYEHISKLSIITTIVQPRADHTNGSIRSHTYTYEEIREFEGELKVAVEATKKVVVPDGEPTFIHPDDLSTGDHCRWCSAKAMCPKMEQEVKETAMTVFKEDKIELPEPKDLDIERIVKVLEFSSVAQLWFKAVEAYAFSLADSGTKIPGYKLVAKKSNRKWIAEDKAINIMFDAGIDPYNKKLKSPAQVEKESMDGKVLAALCGKPDAGVILVSDSDKRPEAVPSIEVFKNE